MSGQQNQNQNQQNQNLSATIHALLKKTEHYDKDERYMATSDLCEALKRSGSGSGSGGSSGSGSSTNHTNTTNTLDASTEKRICTAVLRLLHDNSNDVQAIAVKTLGVLLTTVQEEQVLEIAHSLADRVLDVNQKELKDVYAIGLRTLVQTIPSRMGDSTSLKLVGRLLDGIRNYNNTSSNTTSTDAVQEEIVVLCCLDILTDLLVRFGATALAMTRQQEPILQLCLHQIQSAEPVAVRKKAGTTIAALSVVLSDALLVRMVDRLLSLQTNNSNSSSSTATTTTEENNNTRALIRTLCTVSGAVGHRLQQPQIDQIIPIFLKYTNPEHALTGDDEDDDEEDANHQDNQMQDDDDDDDDDDKEETPNEAALELANELRESCFMGLESFVLQCPALVQPHLDSIIQAALAYMSYDPNYSYGNDHDNNANNEDEEMDYENEDDYEEDDDDDDEDDDDDDDESWKVRRSAIRALKAVVECQKDDPTPLWTKNYPITATRHRRNSSSNNNNYQSPSIVAMALVRRFKEREENCRVGVLDCFTRLLAVTIQAADAGVVSLQDPTALDLKTYAPALVQGCEKLLSVKKGGERSKSHALALLSTLCKAPGGVGGQAEITSVFTHIQSFLASSSASAGSNSNSNSNNELVGHREASSKALRLEALSLVHAMLSCHQNHDPIHIRKGLWESLLSPLCQAVQEQWYKVIAEALRALAAVPHFFVVGYENTENNSIGEQQQQQECNVVANQLYMAMEPLLAAHDVDQEIKECAMTASASLLRELHTFLSTEQTSRLLALLLERLKNETTRIVAIKTLAAISEGASMSISSTILDLSCIRGDCIATMASFLKLQSRSLKQSALEALDIIVTNHQHDDNDGVAPNNQNSQDLYSMVLEELAPLVVDSDLHITHLALRASISVLKACPGCGPAVKEHVLPQALVLSASPLLQDLALDSLLALLEQIVLSGAVDFAELLALLRQNLVTASASSKHAIENLAKCISIITSATSIDNRQGVLLETLASLDGSTTPEDPVALKKVQLALLMSGDLGRIVDLSTTMEGVSDKLLPIYMGYFESPSEDLKNAAAFALGRAAVGAQSVFLPAIVHALESNNQKKQYLLLSALRAFIQCSYQQSGGEGIAASLPIIMPHLEHHCSDAEEGGRTMVAECMGSLTCMQPAPMLEKLSQMVASHASIAAPTGTVDPSDTESKKNSLACWTIATSIKLAIAGKADPVQMAIYMPRLLKLLELKELGCRNAALLMVYSAAHHMPQVVAGLMKDQIMPSLYEVATVKLERKVDLGPFTHTVDDALPLRKASLSIFATCLENLPASLDIASFMPVLAKALGDVEDVQLQAHQIVMSMCIRQSAYVVAAVETFVDPLEKTMHKKQGQKVGTELERLHEWIKSALRTMVALSKLEGAMTNRKFADLYSRTRANSKFQPMLEAIAEER